MSEDKKREEIKDRLDELGVDYDGRKSTEDLEQILVDTEAENDPENKEETPEEGEDEKEEEEDESEETDSPDEEETPEEVRFPGNDIRGKHAQQFKGKEPTKDDTEVDVVKRHSDRIEYLRTYSEADHGKDFVKLAEQFASHTNDSEIWSGGVIKSVIVEFREYSKDTNAMKDMSEEFSLPNKAFKDLAFTCKNRRKGTAYVKKAS